MMRKESILELLFARRMDTALEEALEYSECYQNTNWRIEKHEMKLDKMNLNKKQRRAVDRLLSAYNSNSSEYGRLAYKQGFRDCVILMQEIKQLKNTL